MRVTSLYRLPEETISKIIKLKKEEGLTCIQLAKRFNVSNSTIEKIMRKAKKEKKCPKK